MTFLHTLDLSLLVVVVSGDSYEGFGLGNKECRRCQRKNQEKSEKMLLESQIALPEGRKKELAAKWMLRK